MDCMGVYVLRDIECALRILLGLLYEIRGCW